MNFRNTNPFRDCLKILVLCSCVASARAQSSPPAEIVSAWKFDSADIVLVFSYDGSYYLIDGDTLGMERGTFSWDKETQAFSATAIVDTNDTGGLSHPDGATTVSVGGTGNNTLTYTVTGEGAFTFTRVVNTSSAIVGSWIIPGSKFSVTFLSDNTYYLSEEANDAPFGYTGMERGTYTWNSTTKAFNATVITNTNGDVGFSHISAGVTVNISGNSLIFAEGADSATLLRLTTNPTPITLPDFEVARFVNYIQTSNSAPALRTLDLANNIAPYGADAIVSSVVNATAPTIKIGTGSPIPIVEDGPGSFENEEQFSTLSALNSFLPASTAIQFKSGTATANLTTGSSLTFPTTPKLSVADGGSWTGGVYQFGDNEVLRWTLPTGFVASQYVTVLEIADKITGDDIFHAVLHGEVTHFDLGGKLNPDDEYEVEIIFYRIDSSTTAGTGVFAARQGYVTSAASTVFDVRSRDVFPVSPSITEQPQSQLGIAGSPLTLTVGIDVDAFPFANFQWFKNNVAIPGQTGNSLFFPSYSELEDEGKYHVTVSSDSLTITSNVARVGRYVEYLFITNEKQYRQTSPSLLSEDGATFDARVEGVGITNTFPASSISVRKPDNTSYALALDEDHWDVETDFPSFAALRNIFPTGTYIMDIGAESFSIPFAGTEFPNQPIISSTAGTWVNGKLQLTATEAASAFTLSTNNSTGNGWHEIAIADATDTDIVNVISNTYGNPSLNVIAQINAGTLSVGQSYEVDAIFGSTVERIDVSDSSWADSSARGYEQLVVATRLTIEVVADPVIPQTITFPALSNKTFGDASFSVTASASSSLPVTLSIFSGPATISGNMITLTGAGTVVVRAAQAGNVTYSAAENVDQSFTVSKANQTITFSALANKVSTSSSFTISASASSSLPVSFVASGPAFISGNTVTLTGDLGTVTITASQAGNSNYFAAADVNRSFEVTAVPPPLALTNLTQTYTGTPRAIGTTGGSEPVVITYGGSATPPTNAGTYAVTAVSGSETINGSLIIAKAPLTITADDKSKLGGQAYPPLTVTYSGFLNTDNATNALTKAPTITTTATKTSTSGNYPITPAGATSLNYSIAYVQGNMQVGNWAGRYEALLEDPATSVPVGKIEITVASTNTSFTGILTTAKEISTVSFKGIVTLDPNDETLSGVATATVGKDEAATTYNLTFDLPLEGDFSASVTSALGSATATDLGSSEIGKKLVFPTGKPPVSYAGDYTLIFAPDSLEDPLPRPLGYSHATAKIDSKGKLALNMKLADGTKFSTSLYPDAEAGYRLYFKYPKRLDSYCSAWLVLQEHPDLPGRGIIQMNDMQSLYWAKSASLGKDLNYRGGIPESVCPILMDPWLPPVSAKAPNPSFTLAQRLDLNGTGDMDVFHEGLPDTLDLSGLPELVRLNTANKVEVLVTSPVNPRAWKMTLKSATGDFTGSHTALDGVKSIVTNFSGVMRQPPSTESSPQLIGAGYSIVPQLTGQTDGTLSSAIYFTLPDPNE